MGQVSGDCQVEEEQQPPEQHVQEDIMGNGSQKGRREEKGKQRDTFNEISLPIQS